MKARKLSDFIKPLSSEPLKVHGIECLFDKLRDCRTCEANPNTSCLPELKTGNILRHKNGALYRVYRVNKSKTGLYDEPKYRLEKLDRIKIKGRTEFSGDELSEFGMTLEGNEV